MSRERRDHTLQATALVHEAYLRVMRDESVLCGDEQMAVLAMVRAMRMVLVDHARRRHAAKRPTSRQRVSMGPFHTESDVRRDRLILDVNESLNDLRELDSELADIVDLRFFARMDEAECALLLKVSKRTIRRRWRVARYWLAQHLDLR